MFLRKTPEEKIGRISSIFLKARNASTIARLGGINRALSEIENYLYTSTFNLRYNSAEFETVRSMYSALLSPLSAGNFSNIVELRKMHSQVSWLFKMVKSGVANSDIVSLHLGVSKRQARKMIKDMKGIIGSELLRRPFSDASVDVYVAILDKLGITGGYSEFFEERAGKIAEAMGKLREEIPELYDRVAPHIHREFQKQGLHIELPPKPVEQDKHSWEYFEKNLLQPFSSAFKMLFANMDRDSKLKFIESLKRMALGESTESRKKKSAGTRRVTGKQELQHGTELQNELQSKEEGSVDKEDIIVKQAVSTGSRVR